MIRKRPKRAFCVIYVKDFHNLFRQFASSVLRLGFSRKLTYSDAPFLLTLLSHLIVRATASNPPKGASIEENELFMPVHEYSDPYHPMVLGRYIVETDVCFVSGTRVTKIVVEIRFL